MRKQIAPRYLWITIFWVIIVSLLLLGIARATETKTYSGFTVVYNAETQRGYVYTNNKSSSALTVLYPSADKAYIYFIDGQVMITYEKWKAIEADLIKNNLVESIIAIIQPKQVPGIKY